MMTNYILPPIKPVEWSQRPTEEAGQTPDGRFEKAGSGVSSADAAQDAAPFEVCNADMSLAFLSWDLIYTEGETPK